jgi:ABC-type phosphate transport system permease subunit
MLHHLPAVVAALVMIVAFVNLLSGGRNLVFAVVTAAIVVILIVLEVRLHRASTERKRDA